MAEKSRFEAASELLDDLYELNEAYFGADRTERLKEASEAVQFALPPVDDRDRAGWIQWNLMMGKSMILGSDSHVPEADEYLSVAYRLDSSNAEACYYLAQNSLSDGDVYTANAYVERMQELSDAPRYGSLETVVLRRLHEWNTQSPEYGKLTPAPENPMHYHQQALKLSGRLALGNPSDPVLWDRYSLAALYLQSVRAQSGMRPEKKPLQAAINALDKAAALDEELGREPNPDRVYNRNMADKMIQEAG